MINIEIRAPDVKKLKRNISSIEKQSPTLIARAINRAALTAKTSIGKSNSGVPNLYRIKANDVKGAVKIKKNAKTSDLVALIEVKGRPRPLVLFSVSPKRRGKRQGKSGTPKAYKAAVKKKNSLKKMDVSSNKPFYAITKKGMAGIFSRGKSKVEKEITIKKQTKAYGPVNYTYKTKVSALQMHFGPSVPQMAANEVVMARIRKDADNTLKTRLAHEMNRYIERLEK